MKKFQKIVRKALCAVRGRAMAGSALLMAAALIFGYATLNMRTVSVTDGDREQRIVSSSTDSGAILRAAGLELDEADTVTVDWQFARAEINVTRAFEVTLSVDGVSRMISMTEGTVADALLKADITLGEDDEISLPPETELTEATDIAVHRVRYEERQEIAEIPYSTRNQETSELDKGVVQQLVAGENGEKTLVYRDKLVDGEVAESELLSESITKEPVDEVIAVGIYVAPTTTAPVPQPDVTSPPENLGGATPEFSYSAVYRGSGTAYTCANDPGDHITASGMVAQRGVVAVDPRVIPYGTRLYIAVEDGSYPDYGYCVAGDTGGFVYNGTNTIADLYYDTLEECIQFGRRNIIVYVLD